MPCITYFFTTRHPAIKCFEGKEDAIACVKEMKTRACDGADSTKTLGKSGVGRAVYQADGMLLDVPDPGAVAVSLFISAAVEVFVETNYYFFLLI
jgi:hypothetical protein